MILLGLKTKFYLTEKVGPLEPGWHEATGTTLDWDDVILSHQVDYRHEVNADDLYEQLDNQ